MGLAVADDQTMIVSPAGTIEAAGQARQIELIVEAVKTHEPDALVVGLPLNMDGSEGPAAAAARNLADALAGQLGISVHLADERQTSEAADQKMQRSGLTYKAKKARRDALAAAAILERFLHAMNES